MTNCNHNATLVNTKELSMPALTIKNIPESLYQQLKNAAELHRRSINSEVIVCLEKTLAASKITPADRLSRIEQLRSGIRTNNITPEDIELAINSGRP
jgi:plasmid stability protein